MGPHTSYQQEDSFVAAGERRLRRPHRHRAPELRERLLTNERFTVLDVRNPGELEEGAIEGSVHIPLAELNSRMGQLTDADDIVVYCAGGYRSSIAASVLRAELTGSEVSDLVGGFAGWEQII